MTGEAPGGVSGPLPHSSRTIGQEDSQIGLRGVAKMCCLVVVGRSGTDLTATGPLRAADLDGADGKLGRERNGTACDSRHGGDGRRM